MKSFELAQKICGILNQKKCEDLICIDVMKITSSFDFVVICSGTSKVAVKSIAGFLRDNQDGEIKIIHADGEKEGDWVALDYGHVIVHIFTSEVREFYNLEKLFDAQNNKVDWEVGA